MGDSWEFGQWLLSELWEFSVLLLFPSPQSSSSILFLCPSPLSFLSLSPPLSSSSPPSILLFFFFIVSIFFVPSLLSLSFFFVFLLFVLHKSHPCPPPHPEIFSAPVSLGAGLSKGVWQRHFGVSAKPLLLAPPPRSKLQGRHSVTAQRRTNPPPPHPPKTNAMKTRLTRARQMTKNRNIAKFTGDCQFWTCHLRNQIAGKFRSQNDVWPEKNPMAIAIASAFYRNS